MIIKFLKKYSFFTTISGSFLVIVILALTNFDALTFFDNHLGSIGTSIANYVKSNKITYTFNSCILILIINFCIFFFSKVPKFNIIIRNSNMKSDSTELRLATSGNHTPKTFYIEIKIDYSIWYWFLLFKLLGGLNIKISYPEWVDFNLDNRFWNTTQFVNNTNRDYILVDISKALPKSKMNNYSGEFFVGASLITNLNSYDEDHISISLKPKSSNKIIKSISYLIIFIFFDVSYKPHILKASN
ncbi:hypothetical protein [Paraclostridium sordellii]|uniref:hypothetical protein n=1 Tax=Paraclostridium sordellii TaxID=1505 RepID=UPI001F05E78D|nr:hypothetical protein [Paeniclostridium sordellii]MCH1965962.1 hypothetical protein [Paeniclostridium sordellii]